MGVMIFIDNSKPYKSLILAESFVTISRWQKIEKAVTVARGVAVVVAVADLVAVAVAATVDARPCLTCLFSVTFPDFEAALLFRHYQ